MAPKQDNNDPASGSRRRRFTRPLLVLLLMVVLGGSATRAMRAVGTNIEPVGFGTGVWQGAVMPCALPLLALGQDILIYAPLNTGRTYHLGYTLGVNLCGLVFFSLLFTRLSRWRRRTEPASSGSQEVAKVGVRRD